jgi:penicillin-binding protein 1C
MRSLLWLLAALTVPLFVLVIAMRCTAPPRELTGEGSYSQSVRYVDREGTLLREVRADDATRARFVPLDEVGMRARSAVLAAEDQRFYTHGGVDGLAVARAAFDDVRKGHIVSGASTLTMQLARVVRPHRRGYFGKLKEMAFALRIEQALPKDRILEAYLNRAPFGPSLRGIDSASRYYFDKPPRLLSWAEAATLAAIPRGPDLYSPAKHPDHVLRRRNRILDRMLVSGSISAEDHDRAVAEPLQIRTQRGSFGAPHLVDALSAGRLGPKTAGPVVVTTIQRDVQAEAELAAAVMVESLRARHVTAASVLVLDNQSGEALAYVGSHDFGDGAHGGQNDGILAHRQPGSTLKPFVYGLGMETRDLTAASLLPDLELHIALPSGTYSPKNYDERFHGPVRLREALANSYNVPAVWTAHEAGVGALLDKLHALGFASLTETPTYYGPALALGDGEVTLLELTNAYATLARGGVWRPVRFLAGKERDDGRRVMSREVAAVLTDVLKDKNARLASFGERSVLNLPFEVAVKTGTSKSFRDNWTVGYTDAVTVGVWVGNFDGSAMDGVSGITGAGPLFRSVMEAAMRGREATPMRTAGDLALRRVEVCPLSGGAPTAACRHRVFELIPEGHALAPCDIHEHVRVDTRNGLRAGPGCPATFTEERIVERHDARYAAWAAASGREIARDEFSPLCPGTRVATSDPRALRVGYPLDGTRFAIDPDRPRALQSVAVRIEPPSGVREVAFRVDGRVMSRTVAPFVAHWELSPGVHTLQAEAPGLPPSDPVRVEVD